MNQFGETRRWIDVLPVIEFVVNNSPNRATGYNAFYLSYGYHPLYPLQLPHALEDTRNEDAIHFTSRLQADFNMALEQLNRAREQMRKQVNQHRRSVEYNVGE